MFRTLTQLTSQKLEKKKLKQVGVCTLDSFSYSAQRSQLFLPLGYFVLFSFRYFVIFLFHFIFLSVPTCFLCVCAVKRAAREKQHKMRFPLYTLVRDSRESHTRPPPLGFFLFYVCPQTVGVCLFVLSERKREGPSFCLRNGVCVYVCMCTSCSQGEMRVQLRLGGGGVTW